MALPPIYSGIKSQIVNEVVEAVLPQITPTYIQPTQPSTTSAALWIKTTEGSDVATLWAKATG